MPTKSPQLNPYTALFLSVSAMGGAALALPAQAGLDASYGRLPISFEPNVGQAAPEIKYLAHSGAYSLGLGEQGAVLAIAGGEAARPGKRAAGKPAAEAVLRLSLAGANAQPEMVAENPQPSFSNYFIGRDPSKWHSKVANYGAVRYKQAYPGIDWLVYGNPQQLEYDLVVAPNADPGQIRLGVAGADHLSVDKNGDLLIRTKGHRVRQLKPVVYQTAADGSRQPVAGRYVLGKGGDKGEVRIALGDYDHSRALTIDPVLAYSTFLGGNAQDVGVPIATDSSGAVYVGGGTLSANFPTTGGAVQAQYPIYGNGVSFISKLSADGSHLIYSTYLGGTVSNGDSVEGIVVDASGEVYMTGATYSGDFPVTPGAYQTTNHGGDDIYVAKLSADGSSLMLSTLIGGSSGEIGIGIALDPSGAIYVCGGSNSLDYPTTPGAYQATMPEAGNSFPSSTIVSKLSADASQLLYSSYLGGSHQGGTGQLCYGIAVDGSGQARVAGVTDTDDFPTTSGALQPASGGGTYDGFVSELSADGGSLIFSTYLGGSGGDEIYGLKMDGSGALYVTGPTSSLNFPTTPGAARTHVSTKGDSFVGKLSADGSSLIYSTYFGDTTNLVSYGIAIDASGAAYTVGYSAANIAQLKARNTDIYVYKISANGKQATKLMTLAGSTTDYGFGIAVDGAGAVYITGSTQSTDFPVTSGAFQTSFGGNKDAFVAKITQ